MLELYIYNGKEKLRCGYTTGTCAAIAAKACALMIFSKKKIEATNIITPKGIEVRVQILDIILNHDFVSCAVEKDGGDDIDVTDGILIYATLRLDESGEITVDGGEGVGRVTKKGLKQNVGEAAINETPKKMIIKEVKKVFECFDYKGGGSIIISVPNGREIAKKTFNPYLGIENGISILGTGGIVEPKSVNALKDSIFLEMKILKTNGIENIILTPGNYGQIFLESVNPMLKNCTVKCSNFIGDSLDFASRLNFKNVIYVGHIGKAIKIAGGIMNTHSGVADCRREIFAAHAALNGADINVIYQIMNSITTIECLHILETVGLKSVTMNSIIKSAQGYLNQHVKNDFNIGIVIFDNNNTIIGESSEAINMLSNIF